LLKIMAAESNDCGMNIGETYLVQIQNSICKMLSA
jgi:hypothetical protein